MSDPTKHSLSREPMPRLVGAFLLIAMVTSAFARVEPAPFDLLICLWFALSFLMTGFAYHPRIRLPAVGVTLFIVTTLATLPSTRMSIFNIRFTLVSLYLSVLWFFLIQFVVRYGAPAKDALLDGWLVSAVGSTAITLVLYFGRLPGVEIISRQGRVFGFFKDPNVYSAYLILPFLLCFSRFLRRDGPSKLRWGAALLVIAAGLIVTYSRAAWGTSILGITAYGGISVLSKSRRGAAGKGIVVFGVAMLAVGALLQYLLQYEEIATMLSHRSKMQRYDNDRFFTQFEALRTAIDNPLGLGPGVSEGVFTRAIHSLYIRALVENGVLGLLSVALVLGTTLVVSTFTAIQRRSFDPNADATIIAAALWAVAIQSVVIDSIHWRHFWMLLALGWWLPVSSNDAGTTSTTKNTSSR
jgi:O-antigen ligase